MIQGYDSIYESPSLAADDRATIERDLLRKCCEVFLLDDKTVDKTNNWATWATAAVAMTGYTIGDQDFGRGSAGTFILAAIIIVFTVIQGRVVGFGRREARDG